MSRPHEPLSDAVRIARDIVLAEGTELALASRAADAGAIENATVHLTTRITQALLDARQAAIEDVAACYDGPGDFHIAAFIRALKRA